ncbi:hypothetical protein [Bradyrhizobium sp. CCBAU 53338]|uniref:hypothetical protein n=1 Tax=Bradyrhizobium sp. CCBAU 53338 TaxID=1325111 RepID=UPI00188B81A9|nr:hypothetical protein [Bradyrhizobium sp. CCBAU 53338]
METATRPQIILTARRPNKGIDTPPKLALLYELAIHLAIGVDNSQFDELYYYADSHSHLSAVRGRVITSPLEDWRREDAARASQQASDDEQSAIARRHEFERDKSEIASGRHLGWLQWLAEIYFDENMEATPYQRLEQKIGAENAEVAIAGFKACLHRTDLPTVKDVGKASAQNRYPKWWYAHTTQLDRLYTADPEASGYGIYGVFWFGPKRPRKIPARPDGGRSPSTAMEMLEILTGMIPAQKREKLSVVVLDVSGPAGAQKNPKGNRLKTSSSRKRKGALGAEKNPKGTKRRGNRTKVPPPQKRKPSVVRKGAKTSASIKLGSKRKKRQ